MKTISVIILAFAFTFASAQSTAESRQNENKSRLDSIRSSNANKPKPTTLEEYNFCVTGYADLTKRGLYDMPNGYELKKVSTREMDRGTLTGTQKVYVENYALLRSGEQDPCAVMIRYKFDNYDWNYIAIPTADASNEIQEKFTKSVVNTTSINSKILLFAILQDYALQLLN